MKEEKISYESPWLFEITASIFAGRDEEEDEERGEDSGKDSSDIGGGGFN